MVLSIIFMILNWIAFSGWMFVCYKLLVLCRSWNDDGYGDIDWMRRIIVDDLQKPVLALEGICIIEVFRLLLGQLKGNVILGVILHAIRLLTVLETIVRLPNHWTGPFILGSWAITEIFRYPMYMFPNNQLCRSIRMVVPIVTFPIGASIWIEVSPFVRSICQWCSWSNNGLSSAVEEGPSNFRLD